MNYLTRELKSALTMLLMVVGLMFSCTPPTTEPDDNGGELPPAEEPNIERIIVNPMEHTLEPGDTSFKVLVSSTCFWDLEGLNYWCHATPDYGDVGDTEVTISVSANHEGETRSNELTFSTYVDVDIMHNISISQRSFYDVTALTNRFEADHNGGTFSTEVLSDKSWEIVGAPDWIGVEPTTGSSGESRVELTIEPYKVPGERSAQMVFVGDFDSTDTIYVHQTGLVTFEVGPTAHETEAGGDTIRFSVLSNVDFNVEWDVTWLKSAKNSGSASEQEQEFTFFVARNYTVDREATIRVTAPEIDSTVLVTVAQEGSIELASGCNITRFRFLKQNNPGLSTDVSFTVAGDSIVGVIPDLNIDITRLIPNISASNRASVYVKDVRQESGKTPQDFSKRVEYLVVAEDGTEHLYTVVARLFTGLPILYLNTDTGGEIASKEVWEGATYSLYGNHTYPDIPETPLQVKGRGNSSWHTFLKKRSYNMKLEERTELVGMPEHKRWCLISNYRDKTLLRNQVAMELGRVTNLEWVPRGVQVELVKNGTHRGTYLLSEQIRVDENRLDINEMHIEDVNEPAITGGYVLEIDRYGDASTYTFNSNYITGTIHPAENLAPIHVKIPSLEEGNQAQFSYIEHHFREAEEAICNNNGDWSEALSTYIDLGSIIDQWLIYEITATPEPARGPYSFYLYKKSNDTRFYGGPLWDFDFLSFIPSTQNKWVNNTAAWIPFLWECPEFRATVKAHWDDYRTGFYEVATKYIDEQEAYLKLSAEANWAIHHQNLMDDGRHENGDETLSSTEAIQRMREVLKSRLDWLDEQFAEWANAGAGGTIDRIEGDNSDKDKEDFWN